VVHRICTNPYSICSQVPEEVGLTEPKLELSARELGESTIPFLRKCKSVISDVREILES
jgi:hypothetical protein